MLAFLLLASLAVQDPVRVNTRLTQDPVAAGETTILRVEVETGGERARIARFTRLPPGVELVSTRDFDQRQFSLPGGTRRFVTREFVLRALSAGRYRIPALDVEVDGRAFSTESVILTVTSAASQGTGEGDGVPGEVALRAWLDADTAYVGQQVTMNAEAMFSQSARLRLRRSPEYEAPSPSGFWIHELPPGRGTGTRMVDGRIYEVQGFRRAFFPLTPGTYEIPPARLEYEMRRGILYAPETFALTSDPMPLVVLPPPDEGRPENFTGAVGQFVVRGWLEPAEVPAGEAAVLSLEVRGAGNVKSLPPPELPELDGVEVYPPAEESEETVTDGVVRGVKRFSWVLIPRQPGELSIPALEYPYFDPEARAYDQATADEMTLRVGPGAPVADQEGTGGEATIRYLKTQPEETSLAWVRSPWFAAAQGLPLLALLAGLLVRRASRRGVSRRDLARRRRAGIRGLEERVDGSDPAFFSDLETLVREWLGARLGLEPRLAVGRDRLVAAGIGEGTASSIRALVDRLAAARYAPTPLPPSARRELLRGADRLLERVDAEAPWPAPGVDGSGRGTRAARGPGVRAGMLVPFLLLTAAASGGAIGVEGRPAVAQSPGDAAPAETFQRGVDAFDAGEHAEAVALFCQFVTSNPEDAAGWYNLGTAYHQAGESGAAIWAWLHVPRLDPRDRDTRHNLRVAGASPELVRRAAPAVPLRVSELMLLASIMWFITGGAGAWWILRRGRLPGAVAAVGLALMVAVGAALMEATRSPETLVALDHTTLQAGPVLRGEVVDEVEAGAGLIPVSRRDEWLRVRTLSGREGWLEDRFVGALPK